MMKRRRAPSLSSRVLHGVYPPASLAGLKHSLSNLTGLSSRGGDRTMHNALGKLPDRLNRLMPQHPFHVHYPDLATLRGYLVFDGLLRAFVLLVFLAAVRLRVESLGGRSALVAAFRRFS